MTKREFKEKCAQEKTSSYKLILLASILTSLGLIIVLVTFFAIKNLQTQSTVSIIGSLFAISGIILYITGQIKMSKEYKEYTNNEK